MIFFRHKHTEQYLITVSVSFVITVILLRLYLELAGYPQVGNDHLHIAHMLWGGLILFFAGVLSVTFQGENILKTCAVLYGVGFGFFIDEVGKFITTDYNYFYAPAAAIIYVFMISTFLVAWYFNKRKQHSPNEEMSYVLEDLKDILEESFYHSRKSELVQRLKLILSSSKDKNLKVFAKDILDLINNGRYRIHKPPKKSFESGLRRIENKFKSIVTYKKTPQYYLLIYVVLKIIYVCLSIFLITSFYYTDSQLFDGNSSLFPINTARWFVDFYVLLSVVYVVGLFIFFIMFVFKKKRSLQVFKVLQLFSIFIINIFKFYFEQFSATNDAIFDAFSIYIVNILINRKKDLAVIESKC